MAGCHHRRRTGRTGSCEPDPHRTHQDTRRTLCPAAASAYFRSRRTECQGRSAFENDGVPAMSNDKGTSIKGGEFETFNSIEFDGIKSEAGGSSRSYQHLLEQISATYTQGR